jgi:hypothetical protein
VATDLPSAIVDAAAADGTLAGAGLGTWHFGIEPEGGYPYVVFSELGTRIKYRNYSKGQIHEQHLRINIFSGDPTEAATLGNLARAFLESLEASPPTFDEGRFKGSHQTGEDLIKARKTGVQGVPFVWIKSITWALEYSRDRA